ncbi:MAG: DSD1 family PLP-dependent enzyme [Pseudomonadota bacterium]|nr:DSD1 family PLP-dependent enzyme [Pseudomonadota bacterium]MEC9177482.1 DSD1 family PLP-dependent enzyme [Pseudomonadota bacterium]
MAIAPPAVAGMSVDEVDTPALIIDLDAFERNLDRMAAAARDLGVGLRAHAKTHKSPIIAAQQIARGAVGQCCQKVGEAEILVAGGVRDVLVSNQVIGARKIDRVAALARQAVVRVCVDDAQNVDDLAAAAARFGSTLSVLVEIDVGTNRCGVAPGAPAVALARRVADHAALRFDGLQAYHGAAQHIRGFSERKAAIDHAIAATRATIDDLTAAGLPPAIVGGAGTGTFRFEGTSGVYTEIQAGSYVFMDADYGRVLDADGDPMHEFEHSLFVLATVMSRVADDRVIIDGGLKSFAVDSGLPLVADHDEAIYISASDEHGRLSVSGAARAIALGDRLRLIPGHCDPTVNLHDWYVGVRGDVVETVWPVAARGAVF